jgi:S1-C subfamily serine protease
MLKRISMMVALVFLLSGVAFGAMVGKEAHESYIYPIVRVTEGMGGGSGTVVYSNQDEDGVYSTYVLTNHHVIDSAIKIEDVWDSDLGKTVKRERRSVVYVEIFKYRNLSESVGTMKVEAEVILYSSVYDIALLKLRYDGKIDNIAKMPGRGIVYHTMDETVAVGCSLLFPPLPTVGVITRMNVLINSVPFHMSSSQIIFGNSGGAMFLSTGEFIGIPARVAAAMVGWSAQVIPHMGFFIPVEVVYNWLADEYYDFIFDTSKNEIQCLLNREEALKKKKEVK